MSKITSFRSKMILLVGISMSISATITYIIYKLLQMVYRSSKVPPGDSIATLRRIINNIGDINFFLILFLPLSVFFFFLFTRRYAVYFDQISTGIHRLANGDFGHQIEVASSDEFGRIMNDINLANKKLAQAVERGDFAESSKDQLVVNLAHDLRTPLTSVLGYLDLLLRDNQVTDDQKEHYLKIAYTKSQRLESLINELFEITRVNYGKLSIEKSEINISDLLLQVNEELFPIYEANNLTARMDVSPDLLMIGDGKLLARVFENLLNNAIRYGKDGQYVDIKGQQGENQIVIRIINYGNYIPIEDLPYIFDMFYTGNKARNHQEGSTGLGLFISKNIVEQHNGTITAESSVIETIFEVRLPIEE